MCGLRRQQLLLAIDEICGVEGRQLKAVAVGDGVGGASLYAEAAKNAAIVVNVVNLRVTLGA